MKNCPNCGRPTLRTEDWACQWCGYPLLSKSYKKIPKTYREIKEEALSEWGISRDERMTGEISELDEHTREMTAETAVKPEPEKMEVSLAETGKEAEPVSEPITKPVDEQLVIALPERISGPAPEPNKKRVRKAVPKAKPKPELETEAETEKTPGAEKRTDMETVLVQKQSDEVSVSPEKLSGKAPISVEELNSFFSGDKIAANTKLAGRTLQVAGVVDKVFLREHLDIRYIILTGAGRKGMWNVRGTFDEEHGLVLRRLAEGQKVIMRGEYAGMERNILLKNCAIIG